MQRYNILMPNSSLWPLFTYSETTFASDNEIIWVKMPLKATNTMPFLSQVFSGISGFLLLSVSLLSVIFLIQLQITESRPCWLNMATLAHLSHPHGHEKCELSSVWRSACQLVSQVGRSARLKYRYFSLVNDRAGYIHCTVLYRYIHITMYSINI